EQEPAPEETRTRPEKEGPPRGTLHDPVRAYRGRDLEGMNPAQVADPRLLVEMPFVGQGQPNANAEGWLRDHNYYWNQILSRDLGAFDENNRRAIEMGHAPKNNPQFRAVFPQFDQPGLRSKPLVHHHIGGGSQAVAMPDTVHTGEGQDNVHQL